MTQGTGACGIKCLVCGLMRQGKCSPCGAVTERQAHANPPPNCALWGGVCPNLQCAVQRRVLLLASGGPPLPPLHVRALSPQLGLFVMQIRPRCQTTRGPLTRSRPGKKPFALKRGLAGRPTVISFALPILMPS